MTKVKCDNSNCKNQKDGLCKLKEITISKLTYFEQDGWGGFKDGEAWSCEERDE